MTVQRYPVSRVKWCVILDDLRDAGCSGYRVAEKLGVGWSTVQGWRDATSDIGHGYGRALLHLHAAYCGSGMTFKRLWEGQD